MGAGGAWAAPLDTVFANIDGGTIEMSDFRGKPVLVVNTASQCGFTYQYDGLQALYDAYRDRGLVVLAVPSDDFNQELASAEAVKEFCALNFALDLPMADVSRVKGADAHPFYRAVRAETGFVPRWNFNKVLIAPDGAVAGSWGSNVKPRSPKITRQIEAMLP
nr:glutathione peroxidase [Sulfitobacter sp. S190]